MKISYAVTTHNEHKEISELIPFILEHKDFEDELVIIDDHSDYKTWRVFDEYIHDKDNNIRFFERALYNDFAKHKNFMTEQCAGDYIFNIDADEMPHKELIKNIKPILESNPTIDLYWVPRVNTVDGITQEHIDKWKWNVSEKGWVNFPDYQGRIWRNRPNIIWKNKVHEVLTGYKQHTYLPAEEKFSFYHPKDIKRQEKQNEFYNTI